MTFGDFVWLCAFESHEKLRKKALPFSSCRWTHKDHLISSILSKLQLCDKLARNKEIEDQNKAREMKTYNHHLDPASHPAPGSLLSPLMRRTWQIWRIHRFLAVLWLLFPIPYYSVLLTKTMLKKRNGSSMSRMLDVNRFAIYGNLSLSCCIFFVMVRHFVLYVIYVQ